MGFLWKSDRIEGRGCFWLFSGLIADNRISIAKAVTPAVLQTYFYTWRKDVATSFHLFAIYVVTT
jgi:hypothetical protein